MQDIVEGEVCFEEQAYEFLTYLSTGWSVVLDPKAACVAERIELLNRATVLNSEVAGSTEFLPLTEPRFS